jgi:hypothetical protein
MDILNYLKKRIFFLCDFAQLCSEIKIPTLFGGEFNIITNDSEKSTLQVLSDGVFFSTIIENNNLMDIQISNRKYTLV